MATVKKINITRNWNTRPNDNAIHFGGIYKNVEKGEPYDLVQFSINEISGYYWHSCLCVPCGTSEDEVKGMVEEFVKSITDKQIREYKEFIDFGNKYGWD